MFTGGISGLGRGFYLSPDCPGGGGGGASRIISGTFEVKGTDLMTQMDLGHKLELLGQTFNSLNKAPIKDLIGSSIKLLFHDTSYVFIKMTNDNYVCESDTPELLKPLNEALSRPDSLLRKIAEGEPDTVASIFMFDVRDTKIFLGMKYPHANLAGSISEFVNDNSEIHECEIKEKAEALNTLKAIKDAFFMLDKTIAIAPVRDCDNKVIGALLLFPFKKTFDPFVDLAILGKFADKLASRIDIA